MAYPWSNGQVLEAADLNAAFDGNGPPTIVVVDCGTNLNTARPTGALCVLWRFDSGVDVGAEGVNITNALTGDLHFVAS